MSATTIIVGLITIYEGLILARAIAFWFASRYSTHPILELLRRVTDPVLEPVQRVLPPTGEIDLSPLVVLVALELLKRMLL